MPEQNKTNLSFDEINNEYHGKESLGEIVKKSFPKQLIPTKRFATIFGLIFLAVIIIAGVQFPFSQMLSGNLDITIGIGYPWHFLEFDLSNIEGSPLKLTNLIFDLMLYIILAYVIDIALNLILKNPLIKSEEELKQKPTVFKNKNPTITGKIVEKVFEKPEE